MPELRELLSTAAVTGVRTGLDAWTWVKHRLWPVCSAAALVSVFQMIMTSAEKQVIADHYFGDREQLNGQREDLVKEAKHLFHEEVTLAVKESVWQLPKEHFAREYQQRLG